MKLDHKLVADTLNATETCWKQKCVMTLRLPNYTPRINQNQCTDGPDNKIFFLGDFTHFHTDFHFVTDFNMF